MRQVGVIAAAGIISLEKMTKRLGDDHARAKKMADGLRQVKGLIVDASSPHTNMVYLNLAQDISLHARQVTEKMKDFGVLVDPENARRFRLVTHYQIDDEAVEKAISAFQSVLN
jgi:threonine aldolase